MKEKEITIKFEWEQLTWKDVQQLISIAVKLKTDVYFSNGKMTVEMFYTEVLKRFKNMKGE